MLITNNRGSIMLGFVLLIMVFIGGIFFFSQNILGGTSLVKFQRDDLELELLMHSAKQRASFFIDSGKTKAYSVNVDPDLSKTELIHSLLLQTVYVEVVEDSKMIIGFDFKQSKLYLLVNQGQSGYGYVKQRLCRYGFLEKTSQITLEKIY